VLLADDPNYTIVAANAAYAQATLTKPDDIVGRALFEVFPDNPEDQNATGTRNLAASLRRVLATKAPDTMAPQKYDIRRPDATGGGFEERYWSPVNSPLIGPDGNVQFIIHRVEDITDFVRLRRKEAEQGLLAEAERIRADRMEAELFRRNRELAQVKQLVRENQLLSLLVERSPESVSILDLEGRPVYANQSRIALVGARDLNELEQKRVPEFFVPKERAFVRDVVLPAAREQGRWEGELHFEHLRTKETIPVHYDVFRVDDPATGEATHFGTLSRDLRERKQIEEELRESERRFSSAFAEAPVGMVLTTPEGVILDINRAFLTMLGYTIEEILSQDSAHFTHPDDIARTREFYAFLREHNHAPAAIEKRYVRKDGRILWARASASMRRDGQGRATQLVGIIEDITERKRAETALHQQWHTFDTALSNTPDFTYVFNLEGRFTYINRALLSLLEISFEEAIGKNFFDLGYPPELAERLQHQIKQVIETKGPLRDQTPFTGPNGETGYYEYIFVPILGRDGKVEAVAGSTRDVTERMRAEEDLRLSNEELQRVNRELEEFAFVASHDLQEPLRMVNIYTQILLKDLGTENAKLDQYAAFVQQGVSRMEALINDLLAFSRIVHADEEPSGTADLTESLNDALSMLKTRIQDNGSVIAADPLPRVRADASQMSQVFQNLLSNALKYRQKDICPHIRISAQQDGSHWIISVWDNGIGFEQQYAERIFGLFKRLHKEGYPGTGLGLAICKRIVERYGGRIWAEGRPGEGSTFHFSLPSA